MQDLGRRLAAAIEPAPFGAVEMDEAAKNLWADKYEELTADRPGMFGSLTARSEAQTVRLALIYALLDQSEKIGKAHLEAALDLVRYQAESVRFIFGDALGDPIADRILAELRRIAPEGMSRWNICNELLGRNQSASRIALALSLLAKLGLARSQQQPSATRPVGMWFAC